MSEDATSDTPLAVIVEKQRSESTLAALREAGVYDDSRAIREHGSETIAIPVTEPPAETNVREVVRQIDPEYRCRTLEAYLAERGWSDDELESAPGSWAVIGSVVLVTVPDACPDENGLGAALLDLHGEAEVVLADEGIANTGEAGTYREPRTRHIAGDPDTETIHVEDGTQYALDPTKVMFSPGNQAERTRMGDVVEPGERVYDMFAGIGYFTLPMARAGARVSAAEINPAAFRYLLENAMLNGVENLVDAYPADCRDVACSISANRVVMGYFGAANDSGENCASGRGDDTLNPRSDCTHEFLPAALEALEPGGVLHYHDVVPESQLWDVPIGRLEDVLGQSGREGTVRDKRRVKSYSAGVDHVVLDVVVE